MPANTCPGGQLPAGAITPSSSPALLALKWQQWDDFSSFKRAGCRLPYLKSVADSVDGIYRGQYTDWYYRYIGALESQQTVSYEFETLWRLIVGWGTNATLETGFTMHHFLGFPYIPGSAVKGLLHHVAELQIMNQLADTAFFEQTAPHRQSPPAWLAQVLDRLEVIRLLFGSIYLEQAKGEREDEESISGEPCPRPLFERLLQNVPANPPEPWKPIRDRLKNLLDAHTGGMLRFYDAVPLPGQNSLLQRDIVNAHYGDYYGGNTAVPSDDLEPNPITFLAVRPGAVFLFPVRLDHWPQQGGRDEQERERIRILGNLQQANIMTMVHQWMVNALSDYGIGAKTAAGYGYMMIPGQSPAIPNESKDSEVKPREEETIIPEKPDPFSTTSKPASKLSGIKKNYHQQLWLEIAKEEHVKQITGKAAKIKEFERHQNLPAREIQPSGKTISVFYKHGDFFCEVEVKLQGIANREQAEYMWKKVLFPRLSEKGRVPQ